MTAVDWAGPLFYPPVGKIAVTIGGSRIEVWHNESDDAGCFTGLLIDDHVFDLSTLWDRSRIDHIEEPTEEDRGRALLDALKEEGEGQ